MTTMRVACMDFRLGVEGSSFRNAGGSIAGLEIGQDVDVIGITVHRDCGGLKAVAAILDGADLGLSTEAAKLFEERFVKFFRNQGFEGTTKSGGTYDQAKLAKMEQFNRDLQERLVREYLARIGRTDVDVVVELVDVPRDRHADTVDVLVGKTDADDAKLASSTKRDGEKAAPGVGHAYFVRGESIRDVLASIELAVKVMKKPDIRLVAASGNVSAVQTLSKMSFMPAGTSTHVLNHNGNPKRVTA